MNTLDEQFSLLSSVAMVRFNPAEQVAGFYLQYILSPRGQGQLKYQMQAMQLPASRWPRSRTSFVPVPPLGEQRRIAEILDAADQAIHSTQVLVAKLERARQGLLHDLLAPTVGNADWMTPLGNVSIIAGGATLGSDRILGVQKP